MLAQDQPRNLGGRNVDCFRDQAAEPRRIELRPQPDDLARRQIEPLYRQVREHINGVGDDKHDGILLEPGRHDSTQLDALPLLTLKLAVAEGAANYARINLTQANRYFRGRG